MLFEEVRGMGLLSPLRSRFVAAVLSSVSVAVLYTTSCSERSLLTKLLSWSRNRLCFVKHET